MDSLPEAWVIPVNAIANAVRGAAIDAARTPGWARLLVLAAGTFDSEIQEPLNIGLSARRVTERNELVVLNLNLDDRFVALPVLLASLNKSLGPFIVGVGEVRSYGAPEGVILVCRNDRDAEDRSHEITPGMIETGRRALEESYLGDGVYDLSDTVLARLFHAMRKAQ